MTNKIINIALSGALGRMGKKLIKEIKKNKNTKLILAITHKKNIQHNNISQKKFYNINFCENINTIKNKKELNFNVLIDFSTPENTIKNLNFCIKNNKNIIIGTTGFNNDQMKYIKLSAKKIAIIFSPNFSIGINIMYKIIKYISTMIDKNTDIEIIEKHHRNKIDAPSGTALQLGKKIANSMKWNFNENTIFTRHGNIGKRKKNKIGFSTIRGGDIIGEHTVLFASEGENFSVTHKATNRSTFAKGAVKAAIWISKKKYGFFKMSDLFKNNLSYK